MAQNLQMCEIGDDLKEVLKKFRHRKEKNIAAILMKIDTEAMKVIIEDRFEDCDINELREELPERQPRFVVLSYVKKHNDGRVSFPLVFVYLCPIGCKTELSMMYAGTRNALKNELKLTKDFELRETDDFTTEWLEGKLDFFR